MAEPLSAAYMFSSRTGAGAFWNSTSPVTRMLEAPTVRSVASMAE